MITTVITTTKVEKTAAIMVLPPSEHPAPKTSISLFERGGKSHKTQTDHGHGCGWESHDIRMRLEHKPWGRICIIWAGM